MKYRNGKLSLDTKRQKTSKRRRNEGKAAESQMSGGREKERKRELGERCIECATDGLKMRQKGGSREVDYGCSDLISMADIMMVSFLFIFLAQWEHSRQIGF